MGSRDEQESGGPGGARSTFQQGGVDRGKDERKRNVDGGEDKMDIPLRTMQDRHETEKENRYHSTDEQTDKTDGNRDEERETRNEKRADKTTH